MRILFPIGCVLLGAVMVSGAAWADDGGIPPAYLVTGDESPIAAYVAAARCDCASDAKDLGDSVDSGTLADMSGGTQVIQTTTLTGTVSNDSAENVVSGYNLITGNTLAGEAGIPVVIQNSGSNVLIQNATVLTVQFKP